MNETFLSHPYASHLDNHRSRLIYFLERNQNVLKLPVYLMAIESEMHYFHQSFVFGHYKFRPIERYDHVWVEYL